MRFARTAWRTLTAPLAIMYLTHRRPDTIAYGMTHRKRMMMGYRFWRNHSAMQRAGIATGSSWRAHLVMAMKLLDTPPGTRGDVVECGCWKGAATVNLSIACALTGRRLLVYDSFEGLPPPTEGDPVAERTHRDGFTPGLFGGSLEQVRDNVAKYGEIAACEFHKGWFQDTLPGHQGPIVMTFVDVDYYASLADCLVNLWPWLVEGGCWFLDDYNNIPYCAVFFSEKFWKKHFDCAPPGLIGTGTGVQVGMFYYTPIVKLGVPKISNPESVAYSIKGTRALWDFYPDEAVRDAQREPPG